MALSEAEFTVLVDAGCGICTDKRLLIETIVTQKLPLHHGELFGSTSWGYKGEELVQGTYRVSCVGCKRELYTATACPRCSAAGGVERALATENGMPFPRACAGCGSDLVTATAFVPARVTYEGKRANKARAEAAPEDPGFHAIRVDCKQCGHAQSRRDPCPLCHDD
ncbi:hypothetical protein BH09MYX1_BH09MYX1_45230 [soil metagenome]